MVIFKRDCIHRQRKVQLIGIQDLVSDKISEIPPPPIKNNSSSLTAFTSNDLTKVCNTVCKARGHVFAPRAIKRVFTSFYFIYQLHAKFEHLKKTQVDEKKKLEEKRRMLVSSVLLTTSRVEVCCFVANLFLDST